MKRIDHERLASVRADLSYYRQLISAVDAEAIPSINNNIVDKWKDLIDELELESKLLIYWLTDIT